MKPEALYSFTEPIEEDKITMASQTQLLTALVALTTLTGLASHPASAQTTQLNSQVLQYGDQDRLGTGVYSSDPLAGATLVGLSSGTLTLATNSFGSSFPFTPSTTDFTNTDRIFVGSNQTGFHDGYSSFSGRTSGPLVLTLDYSSLVGVGQTVTSLTLGLAANDFQNPTFGQPFTATINGVSQSVLSSQLNTFNQTGPITQFFTLGLNTALDNPNHILTIAIDEGGDGGDGFAFDFATVGVTTTTATAAPEPGSVALLITSLVPITAIIARRRIAR